MVIDLNSKKDCWDKWEVLAKIFGAVLVPILVAFVAYSWNSERTEQAASAAKIELAMSILRSQPLDDGSDASIRSWALAVINHPPSADLPDQALDYFISRAATDSAICSATVDLRDDLADALIADGGPKSQIAGAMLLRGMDTGCSSDD